MTTYRFAITGLRHHDFANRLDELYDKAMGKRMSISIEHDNPGEMDAVIVYWGRCFVGYVRSDRSLTSWLSILTAYSITEEVSIISWLSVLYALNGRKVTVWILIRYEKVNI